MSVQEVRDRATEVFSILSSWFLRNRLKLNSLKTHFMFIMTSQRSVGKDTESLVKLGDNYVTPTTSEKVLGLTFRSNMSVQTHLFDGEDSILKQVSRKMKGLWLLKRNLSFKARKSTAWGLAMSRILYGIEAWGAAATEKQLKRMQTIQNQIMRFIYSASRRTCTRDLLRMTGMLSFR